MARVLAGAALITALLLAPSSTHAQGRWAVVVARAGESVPAARRAADIAAVRLRELGASVVAVDEARSVVDNALGRRPEPLAPELARRLAIAHGEVLEHVAFGRNAEALAEADPILEAVDAHLAAVGAHAEAGRHAADLCLFTVRALLQDQREPEAEMRTLECLRILPDAPDARVHPPSVRELVERVRAAVREDAHGTIAVEADRPCATWVNGHRVGEAPVRTVVPPGRHEVLTRCAEDDPGRVRSLDVPRGAVAEVRIDSGLATRLHAPEGLLLAYPTAAERSRHLPADAAAIGRLFGVGNVLSVSAGADRTLRLERHRVRGTDARVTAAAELPASPDVSAERVGEAVTALLEGDERERVGMVQRDAGPGVGGWLLGGVGLAGTAAAWILFGTWVELDAQVEALDPDDRRTADAFRDAVADRDDRSTLVLAAGGAGLGLLTASMPFWLPSSDGVPWWSIVAGAAGAAAVAVGVLHTLGDRDELDANGVPRRTIPLGPLVAMHGAPLLVMPLVYALRGSSSSEVAPTLEAHREGGVLGLRGRF